MKLPCDCCTGVEVLTPTSTSNRAGMGALSYRIGTYATFFETMQARLSSAAMPALAKLKTREKDDATIALLDAWSAVGDVLTFYQERIANEAYLRTATERRSILEQARLVGYQLRPGVAASVYLAYTVEKDSPPTVIPKGARANSIPAPGEQMQAFETSDDLKARVEWNAIKPRTTRPQTAQSIIKNGLYLQGTSTNLKPNDPLLIDFGTGAPRPLPFRAFAVKTNDVSNYTLVTLRSWNGGEPLTEALSALLVKLSDIARFGVSPSAVMTQRVLQVLKALESKNATASTAEIATHLRTSTIPALTVELDKANVRDFAKLAPWVNGVLRELSSLSVLFPSFREAKAIRGAVPLVGLDNDAIRRTLLSELRIPASIPPANTKQLSRSINTTFAPKSEIFPALISMLVPNVGDTLFEALGNADVTPHSEIKVYALRKSAPLFGHNAPKEPRYEPNLLEGGDSRNPKAGNLMPQNKWNEWLLETHENDKVAFLDTSYDQILAESPVIVQSPATNASDEFGVLVTVVKASVTASRSAYGLNGKSTRLTLADAWWSPDKKPATEGERDNAYAPIRESTIYCQSELLTLAEAVIDEAVCGNDIEVDHLYDGLESGQWLIVSGERADVPGTSGINASELVMLAGVSQSTQETSSLNEKGAVIHQSLKGDRLHSTLVFAKPLAYCYKRATVTIYGNVVHATHGETRNEVLGAGDASRQLQTFALKQPPLTFTSAPTVSGVESSLAVRVNEVTWREVGSIADLMPNDRKFTTHIDDDAKTFITFGNGERGARLPTGSENIRARYRNGIGKPGNVKAAQISLVATKPLGVKEVINPMRASGGADKESRDQARKHAPLAVMSLDRLVSTQDYADFARSFAGVGKAIAARLSDGLRELVHVTIAGADDIPIETSSDLYRNLVEALHRYGDPYLPLRVEVRDLLALVISANVKVLPDYRWEELEPRIRSKLLDRFGFENRELQQDVRASEVIATIQGVRGVQYVDLDVLRGIDEAEIIAQLELLIRHNTPASATIVVAATTQVEVKSARFEGGEIRRAQLAYLLPTVPDTLILNEVKL